MSFGCRHNATGNICRRLGTECRPGTPGCVLTGRFEFPFHDDHPPAPHPNPPERQPAETKDHGTTTDR